MIAEKIYFPKSLKTTNMTPHNYQKRQDYQMVLPKEIELFRIIVTTSKAIYEEAISTGDDQNLSLFCIELMHYLKGLNSSILICDNGLLLAICDRICVNKTPLLNLK